MRICLVLIVSVMLAACSSSSSLQQGNKTEAAKVRLSLGLTYLKNGNFKQAKYNLDQALKFAPRMADVHYSLAYYYQQVGETRQAQEAFQTALSRAPDNADILNSYGAFLCQQGDYQASETYFHRALEQQEYISAAETYENLALCNERQGKLAEAEGYLDKALKHQPQRAKSLMLMTELLVRQAQWQKAKTLLSRYESTGNVSPDMLLMAYKIEQGLGNPERAESYGDMLVKLYPDHRTTQEFRRQRLPESKVENDRPALQPSPESEQHAAPASEKRTKNNNDYHVVQNGENLYRISVKYNIRIKTLMEWNGLESADDLHAGMKLRLTPPEAR
ncbi:uncharacterized protein HMF8227_02249 [Saliniradius amylolyticus]|uniref:LysM domain-containing protein n=2 Tax=Saliniradius amylolyticus TaxID=2183582 RepID=A0A2S2E598_9ALTE|nr:uncharacterized protein HMF8227_02249 [Saliniradius amylolyticus]